MIRVLLFLFVTIGSVKADEVADGAYLFHVSGCADCHTARESEPLAGGYKIATPFGNFYSPNISPDKATGIGNWTEGDFHRAMRNGISPTGSIYYPVFPYRSYTKMTDDDIRKLYLFIFAQPPINKRNRPHDLNYFYGQRWLLWFWQKLFFNKNPSDPLDRIKVGMGPFRPDPSRSESWNRGAYIVESLLHCAECHTPRDEFGAVEGSQWMAGTEDALNGVNIPNITPDPRTGINWSDADWETFLSSGFKPNGRTISKEMAQVVRNTSRLTKADRESLIEYLRSLRAVVHYVE